MLTPPDDLTTDQVSAYLQELWAIDVSAVSYLPAGHGSHNFTVRGKDCRRWFVKANRVGPNSEFFETTYQTAAELREGGLEFVLAPVRSRAGQALARVSDAWELGLFPHIEGRNSDFDSATERAQIAEVLGRLHAFTPLPKEALRWDPTWLQPELRRLLINDLTRPWLGGPYGEPARELIARHRTGIEQLLTLSERLVGRLAEADEPQVITHGEPHSGNTMLDHLGAIHLIDCDAMFVAPRERDLRLLLYGSHQRPQGLDNARVIEAYQRTAGPLAPRPYVLELFRVEWHLIEITRYATLFSGHHGDSADERSQWRALSGYVPVGQNWTSDGEGAP